LVDVEEAQVPGVSFDELFQAEYRQAEELVQDTFLSALGAWDRVSLYDQPRSWLRRVLLNRCTSRWRRRSRESIANARHHQSVPIEAGPEQRRPDPELVAAIGRLSARQAQVVALHYVDDLKIDEVAMTLDISVTTTKTHLRRAMQALRRDLGDMRSPTDD